MAMTPVTAAWRLGCSVLLGAGLGLFYGGLRPLGKKHRHLADVLFSLGAVWFWLYICFALCRGDIRTVYLLGMGAGLLLWEVSFGRWLRPVFFRLWCILGAILRCFLFPWKKILEFAKKLFASGEKWVTIKCMKIFESGKKRRKESHGRKKHPAQTGKSGSSSCIQYS